ncbi:MAG: hypothetical protein JRI23_26680 [Deltaproteobacteria bacterium]|jgi:hypothetical protein|nr:hypothetical protein [Deltaproteobacteria bacterium]MBW2535632.1 hypothetical protein [Deltaproteobacteria bacterium]
MALTATEILRRLSRDLGGGGAVCLLGIDESELAAALGERPPWPQWPEPDAACPRTAVIAAREVSSTGDIAVTPAAIASAERLGTTVSAIVQDADRVVALLAGAPPNAASLVPRCSEADVVEQAAHQVLCPWAALDVTAEGLVIRELAPGLCARRLQAMVSVPLRISSDVVELDLEGQQAASGGD